MREAIASGEAEVVAGELRDPSDWSDDKVPEELLPFIETGLFTALAEILKKYPRLFWHPIVHFQIEYLRGLYSSRAEWDRIGWAWEPPDGYPEEVGQVERTLEELMSAFAEGFLPRRRRISFRSGKRKPGPHAGFKNPSPNAVSGYPLRVDRAEVASTFAELRTEFAKAKLPRISSSAKLSEDTTAELAEIARRVLRKVSPWWSGYGYLRATTERAGGPDWAKYWLTETEESWDADIESAIRGLFGGKRLRGLKNEGMPSIMAYATLAALLHTDPVKIRTAVDHERAKRRR